ncbi:MAG: hypothetical protein ABIP49_09110, partial [Lysobacterales bacterium]
YGRFVEQLVRLRASRLIGRKEEVEAALRAIEGIPGVSRSNLLEARVLAGQTDEAAQLAIELLRDEKEQSSTLYNLQTFMEAPEMPGDAGYAEALTALIAREDVGAAIREVGRIERFRVYGDASF